jgi:hypothetical protein
MKKLKRTKLSLKSEIVRNSLSEVVGGLGNPTVGTCQCSIVVVCTAPISYYCPSSPQHCGPGSGGCNATGLC